jgi:hypothetical protein
MIRTTNNYVISNESELGDFWVDARVSFWGFHFNEETLQECIDNLDGTYTATYDTIVLAADTPYTINDGSGNQSTITVAAGEYGVKA